MSSPKPVEPSLWRSLLIVKTLHRIAEELHREASYANEAVVVEDKSVDSAFDDNPLETLFCLQNAPVAVFLSEDERAPADDPNEEESDSGKESGMAVDETNEEPSSLIMLSTYLPSNPGAGILVASDCAGVNVSRKSGERSGQNSGRAFQEHDNFADIDCSCLESFASNDLSDINMSIDREFLLGVQSTSCFSALGDYHGGIADLDSLMQVLEN